MSRTFRNENSQKRKRLINLCEHLVSPKKFCNENVPVKLLNELASLSNQKFSIDIKSKYQSLVLPYDNKKSTKFHLKSNSDEMEHDMNDNRILKQTDNNAISSALENDYVLLKCNIVNRSLPLVPAIRIFVPYNYPEANPFVDCVRLDEFEDDMLPEYSMRKN